MTTWRLAAVLLVIAAGLFVIGVAVESGRSHDESSEVAGSLPGVEGSNEHEAAERAKAAGEHADDNERLLGVDVESPLAVTVAVAVSLALAVGLWLWQRRWLAGVVAVVALLLAVFDVAEVGHQVRESGGGLVVLAAVIAARHLAAGLLAGAPRRVIGQ
jgi:Flp pilus assembly protein TadB